MKEKNDNSIPQRQYFLGNMADTLAFHGASQQIALDEGLVSMKIVSKESSQAVQFQGGTPQTGPSHSVHTHNKKTVGLLKGVLDGDHDDDGCAPRSRHSYTTQVRPPDSQVPSLPREHE